MKPGREMDRLVAKEVMGFSFMSACGDNARCWHCGRSLYDDDGCDVVKCHYSTEDDAAKAVVWAMLEKGYAVHIRPGVVRFETDGPVSVSVILEGDDPAFRMGHCWSESFAEAVCVAALRALGMEMEGDDAR